MFGAKGPKIQSAASDGYDYEKSPITAFTVRDQNQVAGQTDRLSHPFRDFWNSYLQHVDNTTRELIGTADFSQVSPALSPARLDAISQIMDGFLRSSEFLRAMRHTLDTIVATKKRLDNGRRHAEEPSAAAADAAPEVTRSPDIVSSSLASDRPRSRQASELWDRFVDDRDDSRLKRYVPMGATPHDVVYEEGSLKLLRYRQEGPVSRREPVLVCFSLINRPYVLDLQPDRSVIRGLLQQGLEVYLIDWGAPTKAERTLCLRDYICGRLKNAVDFVCDNADSRQLNLLGYCLGGTMSAMYTALHPRQVRNLILLAAPIDFSGDESLLNLWTKPEYFDVDGLIDAFGNCPGSLLRVCFQQMKPVQNYVQKYLQLRQRLGDDAFLENFFALERWANDSIPVAGETFREFIKLLYQQNRLVQGQMRLGDQTIDLKRITCPLLILTADFDHLVPLDSALAVKDHVSSRESVSLSIDAGHMGLAVSSKSHQRLWPQATTWIAQHSTPFAGTGSSPMDSEG